MFLIFFPLPCDTEVTRYNGTTVQYKGTVEVLENTTSLKSFMPGFYN